MCSSAAGGFAAAVCRTCLTLGAPSSADKRPFAHQLSSRASRSSSYKSLFLSDVRSAGFATANRTCDMDKRYQSLKNFGARDTWDLAR